MCNRTIRINFLFVLGKLKPRSKRRVSSESPQKLKPSPEKKNEKRTKSKVGIASISKNITREAPNSQKSFPQKQEQEESQKVRETEFKIQPKKDSQTLGANNSDTDAKSPLPIRLPTKCKSKTDSDSDSDCRSTKSSTSSTSKVSKVLKKTFKGKAIAIVKPFSNAVTEKSHTPNEKAKDLQARLNLYEFGSDEESVANRRNKAAAASDNQTSENLDQLDNINSDKTLSNTLNAISCIKGIKKIKSVKQGILSARRVKLNSELKSVSVRVEKLRNNSARSEKLFKVRQNLVKTKSHGKSLEVEESNLISKVVHTSSHSQTDNPAVSKVPSETDGRAHLIGSDAQLNREDSECSGVDIKEERPKESQTQSEENILEKLIPSNSHRTDSSLELRDLKVEAKEFKSDSIDVDSRELKDDKIIEIVKSELFSEPLPIKKEQQLILEKTASDRNDDRDQQRKRYELIRDYF